MSANETPRKTGEKITRIIDRLNSKWNLQIPRLHGVEARDAKNADDIQRKCSSRIRAACWLDNVNIDSVMSDFDDRAKSMHTEWIFKPSQQPGTLPRLPVTKSNPRDFAISKPHQLTPEQRRQLCEALLNLLVDELKLAHDSDVYSRTSAISNPTISTNTSFTSVKSSTGKAREGSRSTGSFHTAYDRSVGKKSDHKQLMSSVRSSTDVQSSKKRAAPTALQAPCQTPKRFRTMPTDDKNSISEKKLNTVNNYFLPQIRSIGNYIPTMLSRSLSPTNVLASFESEPPDPIFSQPDREDASSNNTSMISDVDERNESQDYGDPELDEAYKENDISLLQSFSKTDAPPLMPLEKQLDEIALTGPFRIVQRQLPSNLPYWYTYELYRISAHLDIPVGKLFQKIRSICQKEQPSFDEFWQAAKDICRNNAPGQLPTRSHLSDWTLEDNLYWHQETGKSISLTSKLNFAPPSDGRLFIFELNAIDQDLSCRFHRRFGADRFMTLDVPYFDESSLPLHIKKMKASSEIHDKFFAWLTKNDLQIAGRIWRAFWTEPRKSRGKKRRKEEGRRQRVHLFAVGGFDFASANSSDGIEKHKSLTIPNFLKWHIPIDPNKNSTDLKLFSRMQLGLSRTEPTLALEPHEFIECADIPAQNTDGTDKTDGTIMTDGCARMSLQLAQQVWHYLKKGGDMPTAFQARIGGAKGLWYVDYTGAHPGVSERDFWIEIRPSQLKIKPHPRYRLDADEFTRTFEVVKYSKPCSPGHLNTQFITILENRKVPRSALKNAVEAHLLGYYSPLDEAMTDEIATRLWRQLNHSSSSSREDMSFCGAMPDSVEDEIDMMLEHGLNPSECPFLTRRIKDLMKSVLDAYRERLRIELKHSTTVFCIPDPLGLLEPGQVQMNFSKAIKHPETGFSERYLDDMDLIVGRNPAHLASDMQRVRAVYHKDLRHYEDVIIFPIKGENPLADFLSGGDYDGDTITVIWDPNFVLKFQNHPKPLLASKKSCGIRSQNRLVREIFSNALPTQAETEDFLYTCCSFNGHPSLLGEVTTEWEKMVYADSRNITREGAEKLAAIASYLVDSVKQGDKLTKPVWNKVRTSILGKTYYRPPAYKSDFKESPKTGFNGECVNIIDHLHFDIIKGLCDKLLENFHQNWSSIPSAIDKDLTSKYNFERSRAENRHHPEAQVLREVLDDLAQKLKVISNEWGRRWGHNIDDAPPANYAKVVQELYEKLLEIEPLDCDCDVRREFLRDGGGKGSRWSLIRASALYYINHRSTVAFKLAGDELCRLKARAQGQTWEMTLKMRNYMKADVKKSRRLLLDDDDDVFYDAEC